MTVWEAFGDYMIDKVVLLISLSNDVWGTAPTPPFSINKGKVYSLGLKLNFRFYYIFFLLLPAAGELLGAQLGTLVS